MNAEKTYNQFRQGEDVQGRLAQIKRMAAACWTKYEATLPKDSLRKTTDKTTNNNNTTIQHKSISIILNSLTSTMLLPPAISVSVKDIIKEDDNIKLEK